MSKYGELVNRAEQLAGSAESWADFSNALYSPPHGLLFAAFPNRAERRAFIKSKEYKHIQRLMSDSIDKHGLVEGAEPKKSGKFVVRLPRSLHAALEREAQGEGVSLNQLVVAKLAVQLNEATAKRRRA